LLLELDAAAVQGVALWRWCTNHRGAYAGGR
jgi:hypothetical protein